MAHIATPKSKLGPGFWPVTVLLTVIVAATDWGIIAFDVSSVLPVAAEPAGQIDALFKFLAVFGSAIFIYVTGYIVYFCIAFRRPADAPVDAIGVQTHGNVQLEIWWTVVPALLVVVLGIFSIDIWYGLQTTRGDGLTLESIGHQFLFEFRYPTLKQSVDNELHVPVGTPITMQVTSADVIHSFWVPEVRIKADMVPGLINTLRFTPERVGTYRIICTEFCGTLHGKMVATMYIDTPAAYDKWLADTSRAQAAHPGGAAAAANPQLAAELAKGDATAGKTTFGQKCSACHSVGPFTQKIVGPGLGHLMDDSAHPTLVNGSKPTPENIAGILKNGYQGDIGVMPSAQVNAISDQDIANLVAYLVSLSGAK